MADILNDGCCPESSARGAIHPNPPLAGIDAEKPYWVHVYAKDWANSKFPYVEDIVDIAGDLIMDNPSDEEVPTMLKKWGVVPCSESAIDDEEFRQKCQNKAISGPLKGSRYYNSEKSELWVMGKDVSELYHRVSEAGFYLPIEEG